MKNLLFLFFIVTICSCEKEEDFTAIQTATLIFYSENPFENVSPSLLKEKVNVIFSNKEPVIQSPNILSKVVKINGVNRRFYYHINNYNFSGNNNYDRKINIRGGGIYQFGYLWYGNSDGSGCFVYSMYIEGDNGNILVLGVCTFFNCIGFEPVCFADAVV